MREWRGEWLEWSIFQDDGDTVCTCHVESIRDICKKKMTT